MTDSFSRYLLCCRIVEHLSYRAARGQFEAAFQRYGLPAAIRTDNGSPFATTGPLGLSRLSVWWTRLGIAHERIEPGHRRVESPDGEGQRIAPFPVLDEGDDLSHGVTIPRGSDTPRTRT